MQLQRAAKGIMESRTAIAHTNHTPHIGTIMLLMLLILLVLLFSGKEESPRE